MITNNPPTIHDVARMAGVSTTTVSHTINGTRFVSQASRERVEKAIAELGYRPNSLARGLRSGESKTIGLISPDNSNPFFAEVLRTIENYGYAKGYSVILCNSDSDVNKEISYTELLHAQQVDGIVFISTNNSIEHLEQLTTNGIPMIVMDRDIQLQDTHVILVDNLMGGYQATKHLIDLGHTRIGCITGPSMLTPSADRVRGYQKAVEEAGLAFDPHLIVSGDFQFQGGDAGMAELLSLPQRPTAVFACNDLMALGAMRRIRDNGLSVPEDISLVGFDDIALTAYMSPSLTTVAQPIAEIARLSMELLIDRIQGRKDEKAARRIVLPTQLIIRESSTSIGAK